MNGKYNFIYKELVSADDDLVGLIAYGIYKKHKIEFITKIKREQGREPSDEECKSFFAASMTDSQLRNYRSQAETMLSEMVGNVATEELARYEDDMLRNYKNEISSCIPSNKMTFVISILAGVVSTLLFTVIAGVFYFIGETSDRSTREKTKELMETVYKNPTDKYYNDNKWKLKICMINKRGGCANECAAPSLVTYACDDAGCRAAVARLPPLR